MQKKALKIFLGVLIIGLISLYFIINPSNVDFLPKCPLYKATDLYCPGCGSQRAVHDILHLNFLDAFGHNAVLVSFLVIGLGLFIYSRSLFSKILYHPKSPYIIFGIIILFWILRNMDLFSYFAP
jgi:hypothetical protein